MFITPKIRDSPEDNKKSIIPRDSPLKSWSNKEIRSKVMGNPVFLQNFALTGGYVLFF
jgi:hypothetical protein